ncbi:MAG: hypothetical protein GVX78_03295 [Bacteroidetes bacterium]|nr:hypothetical protein [Bacteroidota bacterium]
MKRIFNQLFLLFLTLSLIGAACQKEEIITQLPTETTGYDTNYQLMMDDYVRDKNFFALSKMLDMPKVKQIINKQEDLKAESSNLTIKLQNAIAACNGQASCLVNELIWTESEIVNIGNYLADLAENSSEFQQMINEHLRPSGLFENYKFANNPSFVKQIWADAAKGINFIMEVYVLGATPVDEDSDGPLYAIGNADYQQLIFAEAENILDELNDKSLFFEANLNLAMALLRLNNRDEAGRFEPLESGENKAALDKLATVNFDDYEYSVIVNLGDSPNSPGDATNISEGAKYRVQIAAERYHEGKAPFILFTGANVFPKHSIYHEAIEMKKWAMQHHDIPEAAILVDPHARNTTTNLRNASRQLVRYGFPLDKKGLITTSNSQSEYVTGNGFANRCEEDFGFFPVKLGARISDLDVEFFPKIIALHVNSIDPLDP